MYSVKQPRLSSFWRTNVGPWSRRLLSFARCVWGKQTKSMIHSTRFVSNSSPLGGSHRTDSDMWASPQDWHLGCEQSALMDSKDVWYGAWSNISVLACRLNAIWYRKAVDQQGIHIRGYLGLKKSILKVYSGTPELIFLDNCRNSSNPAFERVKEDTLGAVAMVQNGTVRRGIHKTLIQYAVDGPTLNLLGERSRT